MRYTTCLATLVAGCVFSAAAAPAQETRMLRRPAVSHDSVVFGYAGDLWVVPRRGGKARRLTESPEVETDPHFSPDGSRVAFTATIGGNTDAYVISSSGGNVQRLTWHPGLDLVRGWTRDGRNVLLGSARGVLPTPRVSSYVRLWTASLGGGLPEMLPVARAYDGAFSPDGRSLAYEEFATAFETLEAQRQSAQWRHYRGGRTHPIRIVDLDDLNERTLPWTNSNDSDPMWVGDRIYFVSDRGFTANLFAWDSGSGKLDQLTHHRHYDVMNASAGPGAIAYEQAGYIHLFDIERGRSRRLRIEVEGDFRWSQPGTRDAAELLRNVAAAPDGRRTAIEARGEIFLKEAADREAVNLTRSASTHERYPAWSLDGERLAWLSDAGGEYRLRVGPTDPDARPRSVELPGPGHYSAPVWSPGGRYLLLRDGHLTLWVIELASGRATRIDSDTYEVPGRRIEAAWSPDSRWIAYSKSLPNHLRAIFLYSLDDGETYRVTNPDVDAVSPVFDRGGAYLYFLVSTDYGQNVEWSGMNSLERPATRSIHAAVLSAAGSAPVPPLLENAGSTKAVAGLDIEGLDIDGLGSRIVALDVPPGDYAGLFAGPAGTLFFSEHEKSGLQKLMTPESLSLHRYRVARAVTEPFLNGVDRLAVTPNGGHLLYRKVADAAWAIADLERAPDGAEHVRIDTSGLDMLVDFRAEWAHIFREAWRTLRDSFYQPGMHGADWQAIYDKYEPFVPHVNHRADLGYLLAMVGGELAVGHLALSGPGDVPGGEPVTVGMLGADYSVDRGRYRIRRIYTGDPWDPSVQAPLTVPGATVREGEYLLEVNGKSLVSPQNLYAAFEGTANRPTGLRVGPTPRPADSRLVTVIPVANEEPLRTYEDWTEKNRRFVDERSGGRVGYLWLVNTGPHGYTAFNRQFFGQLDKEALVVDIRYNQGGYIADYVVDVLTRPLRDYLVMRDGATTPMPIGAVHGPKVMLMNESSGSGGDALAYHFRLAGTGPLIGARTWGGLVGAASPSPETLDGGGLTVPNAGFYDRRGRWLIENAGVRPDIEIENSSAAVMAGSDPQLERAVQEVLALLEARPVSHPPAPASPDRVSPAPPEPKEP